MTGGGFDCLCWCLLVVYIDVIVIVYHLFYLRLVVLLWCIYELSDVLF